MAAPMEEIVEFHSFYYLKLLLLLYITISCILYISVQFVYQNKRIPHNQNILLITAHPDDECMFFAPSLLELGTVNSLSVVCVTTGNYYGQGEVRKKEILKSCEVLGICKHDVHVLDDSSFPDDPKVEWDLLKLQQEIQSFVSQYKPSIILTFDHGGVSGHPNHKAMSQVVRIMYAEKKFPNSTVVLELDSVSLLRKYISFLDLPMSLHSSHWTFISSLPSVFRAQKAMRAHCSQLEWFRYLYIVFSRYMFINTFTEVKM